LFFLQFNTFLRTLHAKSCGVYPRAPNRAVRKR
jgi:hypothetical protein